MRLNILTLLASAPLLVSCHGAKQEIASTDTAVAASPVVIGGKRPAQAVVAKTRIYKTNGDYTNLVPVTLNAARTAVVSFPAPTDLVNAAPISLSDGFLLDRRGVGVNTAFTSYTYSDYSQMKNPPSPAELLAAVIPGAKVTEIIEMPFAVGAPDAVEKSDSLIAAGFPGCTRIYPASPIPSVSIPSPTL